MPSEFWVALVTGAALFIAGLIINLLTGKLVWEFVSALMVGFGCLIIGSALPSSWQANNPFHHKEQAAAPPYLDAPPSSTVEKIRVKVPVLDPDGKAIFEDGKPKETEEEMLLITPPLMSNANTWIFRIEVDEPTARKGILVPRLKLLKEGRVGWSNGTTESLQTHFKK